MCVICVQAIYEDLETPNDPTCLRNVMRWKGYIKDFQQRISSINSALQGV